MPRSGTDRRIVAGLLDNIRQATETVTDLKAAGFNERDIGLAMRNDDEREPKEETGTRAGMEAAKAAVGGGLLGGLTGLLVAAGVLVVPGLGPILAGGALASALGVTGGAVAAGAGVGAAAGGVIGALIGMEIPETEARRYEAGIRAGRILVTVSTRDRVKEAVEIFERHGAEPGVGPDSSGRASEVTLL
jgi:hypothetical protein